MSSRITELRAEAVEALETVWFMQRLEETERTDVTLSLRFHIRPGLFVHVFCGELLALSTFRSSRTASVFLASIVSKKSGTCIRTAFLQSIKYWSMGLSQSHYTLF